MKVATTGVWEIKIPYDNLVAAVREALPGYAPGWVAFSEETMTGCTVFRLRQGDLGDDLGQVKVRKGIDRSELSTKGPGFTPERPWTQEEKDELASIAEREAKMQRLLDISRQIAAERDELRRRRRERFNQVVTVMFNRLNKDTLLQRAMDKLGEQQVDRGAVDKLVEEWKAQKDQILGSCRYPLDESSQSQLRESSLKLLQGLDNLGVDTGSEKLETRVNRLTLAVEWRHAESHVTYDGYDRITQPDFAEQRHTSPSTVQRGIKILRTIEGLAQLTDL